MVKSLLTLIDTGGIEPDNGDIILSHMRNQAMLAMDMAHIILSWLMEIRINSSR